MIRLVAVTCACIALCCFGATAAGSMSSARPGPTQRQVAATKSLCAGLARSQTQIAAAVSARLHATQLRLYAQSWGVAVQLNYLLPQSTAEADCTGHWNWRAQPACQLYDTFVLTEWDVRAAGQSRASLLASQQAHKLPNSGPLWENLSNLPDNFFAVGSRYVIEFNPGITTSPVCGPAVEALAGQVSKILRANLTPLPLS